MRGQFFANPREDEQLDAINASFWDSLIHHIHEDLQGEAPGSVLDVGCHHGGLLLRLVTAWRPRAVFGIEPLQVARQRAERRLQGHVADLRILDVAGWTQVPDGAIDLVTCHEVLYLMADVDAFMTDVRRVLSSTGRAYIVLGCHAENPVWKHWKPELVAMGHQVYDHEPMEILRAAARAGLLPSLRPLRDPGWITHDPLQGGFSFPTASAMIDHHFKHKLLFRFTQP